MKKVEKLSSFSYFFLVSIIKENSNMKLTRKLIYQFLIKIQIFKNVLSCQSIKGEIYK